MSVTAEVSVSEEFHKWYFNSEVWNNGKTSYFGIPMMKCPLDLWVYQELIFRVKPRVIIETGTWLGGSAQFLANTVLLSHVQNPLVITIDIAPAVRGIKHMHVLQLVGSSISNEALVRCKQEIADRSNGPVMVILDSNHRKDHVLAEMNMYAPLVTDSSYMIVEDTNVNEHPVFPDHGPGPYEAVTEFLADYRGFVIDKECEKYGLTFNPSGYLKKVA